MTQGLTDNTGAAVTVRIVAAGPISSYTVTLADGSPAGRPVSRCSPAT